MVKLLATSLLNTETLNGLSLELSSLDDMVTVQSKWEHRFIFWVDSIPSKLTLSVIHPAISPNELSLIEVWEKIDDVMALVIYPSYQGVLLANSSDHQFLTYDYGEIIRINHDQCETLNP